MSDGVIGWPPVINGYQLRRLSRKIFGPVLERESGPGWINVSARLRNAQRRDAARVYVDHSASVVYVPWFAWSSVLAELGT